MNSSYHGCEDGKSTRHVLRWLPDQEDLAAKSNTSAEYIAFDSAVRKIMWLLKIQQQKNRQSRLTLPTIGSPTYELTNIFAQKSNISHSKLGRFSVLCHCFSFSLRSYFVHFISFTLNSDYPLLLLLSFPVSRLPVTLTQKYLLLPSSSLSSSRHE